MKLIAILLTVHNRRAKTLQCLAHLYAQQDIVGYIWDVYLTNDACTDGTTDEVIKLYPAVNIIEGDGNLYWNRGMYKAWQEAANTKDYDYYLWLNDDTLLYSTAINQIIKATRQTNYSAIICGATCASYSNEVTYSGWLLNQKQALTPNGTLQECDIINGNFVLVPKEIFCKIGNLDWRFHHAIGDFDYGLRAQEAGFKCYVAPQFVGTCEANAKLPNWCLSTTPLIKRFKSLYSPLGYAEPIPFFIYEKRHFGVLVAIKHFLSIHLRALLPKLWK